jgi:hypothetical protein
MKVIKYKALFILFLAVTLNNSFAQIKSITGTVIDSASKETIFGANIFIISKPDGKTISSTTSDIDGQFTFKNISEKNISLKLTYIGYYDKFINTIRISDDINLGKIMISSVPVTGCILTIISKTPKVYGQLKFKNINEREILVTQQLNWNTIVNVDTIKFIDKINAGQILPKPSIIIIR